MLTLPHSQLNWKSVSVNAHIIIIFIHIINFHACSVVALAVISTQPIDMKVNKNDSALFNVTIMEDSDDDFTYQWQRNGSDLNVETSSKFDGVNSTELMVNNVQDEDEGGYRCVITNGAGDSVTSNEAILTVGKSQYNVYSNTASYFDIHWIYIVDLPATPTINEVSSESTSITITWEQDLSSDVFGYEIQYNFTIRECQDDSRNVWNVIISDGSLRNYTLVNSTDTPVEEDSDYFIMFTALNSDGKSEPVAIEIDTLAAGIQICSLSRVRTIPLGVLSLLM